MTTIKDNTIWITGAGSGIGKELTLLLAAAGNFVIASGRRKEPLDELVKQYPKNIYALPVDVSLHEERGKVSEQLKQVTDVLDIVIIGAGAVSYEDDLSFDHDEYEKVFGVNFFGMVNTVAIAKAFLQKSQQKAYIVGISSLSMVIGFARAEAYGSSKAAADYFLHSLSIDLPQRKFDVSIVRPGFVETPMTSVNDFPMPFLMSAEQAAQRIIRGMEKRQRLIVFPRRLNWLLQFFAFFSPLWYRFIGPKTSRNILQD